MPIAAIGGAISGASSLISGFLGHNAAGNASTAEQNATNNSIAYQKQQAQNALNNQQQTTANIGSELSPFVNLGQQSAQSLSSLLAPGGQLTQGWNQTFQAPTAEQAAQTPGYQFQLQQGLNALQNSAAARGGLLSTGTAKNLNDYAQGTAASNYQNVYNNALNTYGTNYQTFQNNQNNLYNRLYGTSGLGLSAGGTLGGLQQSGANAQSGIYENSANQVGNNLNLLGQEQAGGIVGGSNAQAGGIGGGFNGLGLGMSLASVLGQGTTPVPPLQGVNPNSLTYGNGLPSTNGVYN